VANLHAKKNAKYILVKNPNVNIKYNVKENHIKTA
jgi:hypothetical protein